MAPANLARLVIDGLDHALGPKTVVATCPSISAVGRLGEINAVTWLSVDNEQSRPGVEAGSAIIRQAALIWCNKASVRLGLLVWVWNRAALSIDPKAPVDWPIRHCQKALSRDAVKDEEVAIARRLHEHLARLSMEVRVNKHRSFHCIPVVRIVRRCHESPHQLARIRIDRDNAARVFVVPRTARTIQ